MIHVNVRGLVVRNSEKGKQLIIQLRKRAGEPEVYELPGGRINEYEKMVDGLKREIMEETGLQVTAVYGEKDSVITTGSAFSMECMKPYASYQTTEGPVDSFGVYFLCEAEGEPQKAGDDSADVHWAGLTEVQNLIDEKRFSEIDLPVVLMFLRDENKRNESVGKECPLCGNEMQEGGLVASDIFISWSPLEEFKKRGLKRFTRKSIQLAGESSILWEEKLVPNAFYCKNCNKVMGIFDVANYSEEKEEYL